MQSRFSDEEPSVRRQSASGSGGRPRQPDFNIRQSNGPKLLRAVAKKHDIVCTKSLVAAYNATTDENERAVLLDWLCKYAEGSKDCSKPKAVLEYAELAKVVPVTEQDAEVLRKLVYGLGSLTRPGEFLDEDVSKSLFSALTWVDSSVYDDTAQLTHLAYNLVSGLSRWPRLTKQNFLKYEANFLCIHQVFFLLQSIGRGCLLEKEKKEFRQAVTQKRDEMEISNLYYPVSFHFELIQQAVERLEIEDPPSRLAQAKRYTVSGLYGGIHVFHFLRKLAGGDIDPTSVEDAYRKGRAAIANAGVSEREWYDILQILTAARICCLKEEKKCEIFSLACDAAMEGQRKTGRENEQKALRFGIVQEMRLLASDRDSSYDGRKEGTNKLVDLAKNQAISENWIHDADILTAILDALQMIHTTCGENQETVEAVLKIQRSCDGCVEDMLTIWLDGNTIEEKLQMRRREHKDNDHEDLFAKKSATVGYLHPTTIRSNIEGLKKTYLHENFATVPSLFEPEARRHVKDMEHHVVAYEEIIEKRSFEKKGERHKEEGKEAEAESTINKERDDPKDYCEQKRKVAAPISIEDLFKPRSSEAGVDKSEIRRVLLYGNPGSGKTCISKAIAHKWALGAIWQELKAIYVVPVRRLNVSKAKGIRGEALEEVISQMCFKQKGSDVEFEELKTQVSDDLEMSSTLLVFDGLDEADDGTTDILSEVEKSECKLLVLTRPYNLRGIQKRVDCQFECLGFNDQQLRNYINKELQQDEASRLIHSLQQDQGMWETAHTPVTAHILCSLSKEHGTSIEDRRKRASMFQIYNSMTNFVWKRFEKKPEARRSNKTVIFRDLEKIAFEALRSGQILIEQRIVECCAASTNASEFFKESGFLLLVLEGQEYQFPHLTFQEYFAGRYIARILRQKGSDAEIRVLDFIRDGKYDTKRALTITFAMHAFAEGRSKQALDELLSIMDAQPVEVLGIRHLFLRMRVLEATLEEADEDEVEALAKDENTTALVRNASQLLESIIDHVLIRETVVEEFKNLPRILERFPRLLDDTVDGVKNILASSDYLTWKETAKITDVLKLARHSPKHSDEVTQFIFQKAEYVDRWCDPKECIRRVELVATHMPQYAGKILLTLVGKCNDEDEFVRRAAVDAIDRVAAVPSHADEYLPMLARKCNDENLRVRWAAVAAFACVAVAAPHRVAEHLPMLAIKCNDEEWLVRHSAVKAIDRVAAAAPQRVSEYLSTLASKCNDERFHVRQAALGAFGRVAAAASQHSGEYLTTLTCKFDDEEWLVRQAAVEAIIRVISAVPQRVGEYLLTLEKKFNDENTDVREAAVETISRVISAVPQRVGEYLPTLASKFNDEEWLVRQAAVEAIDRVAEAAPQHADEYLPMLASKFNDNEHWRVCQAAVAAFGRAAASAPQQAGEYLTKLAMMCVDINRHVRHSAVEAIGLFAAAAPQHAGEYFSTLAEKCDDFQWVVREAAVMAINHIAAAAPRHAGEYLPTLASKLNDEEWRVRWYAVEAIGRVVASAPQQADEYLTKLASKFNDEEWSVRLAAVKAISCVAEAAPQCVSEYLPTLASKLNDEEWRVRQAAVEAIGRVVAAVPQQVGEYLPKLARMCIDKNRHVCRSAVEAIGLFAAAAPQHAGEYLPTLASKLNDEKWRVRRDAVEAIGRVVAAAPQHAIEYLTTLASRFNDEEWSVRRAAVVAIGRVIAAPPHLTGELLSKLASGYDDDHKDVRRAAVESIGRVVSAAPHHAGDLLSTLAMGCKDEDSDVRFAAKKALESVKPEELVSSAISFPSTSEGGLLFFFVQSSFTRDLFAKSNVPFVLHTTSSQVIGKWDKKAIDMFIRYLRQACDKELPRLLENINIIE